jgi:hypothetical protein
MAINPTREVRTAYPIYDPADALGGGVIDGANTDESVEVNVAQFFSIPNLPSGTNVNVMVKLEDADTYQLYAALTGDDGPHLIDFEGRINFAKLARVGAGNFVAFAQK